MALTVVYPAALSYADWIRAANELMAHFEASGSRDETEFRVALFSLVMVQGVLPSWESQAYAPPNDATPKAHALARMQAAERRASARIARR